MAGPLPSAPPITIGALPALTPPLSGLNMGEQNIGQLLSAVGQGMGQAQDPMQAIDLQNAKNDQVVKLLQSIGSIAEFLPQDQVNSLLQTALGGVAAGANNRGGGIDLSQILRGAMTNHAATGSTSGTPQADQQGVAAPATQQTPSAAQSPSADPGSAMSYDQWLQANGHAPENGLSPYEDSRYRPQFQDYLRQHQEDVSKYDALQTSARQAAANIMTRVQSSRDPSGDWPLIKSDIDQYNTQYGTPMHNPMDPNAIHAALAARDQRGRLADTTAQIKDLQGQLKVAMTNPDDPSAAADLAGQINQLVTNANKYLGAHLQPGISPTDAYNSTVNSPAAARQRQADARLQIEVDNSINAANRSAAAADRAAATENLAAQRATREQAQFQLGVLQKQQGQLSSQEARWTTNLNSLQKQLTTASTPKQGTGPNSKTIQPDQAEIARINVLIQQAQDNLTTIHHNQARLQTAIDQTTQAAAPGFTPPALEPMPTGPAKPTLQGNNPTSAPSVGAVGPGAMTGPLTGGGPAKPGAPAPQGQQALPPGISVAPFKKNGQPVYTDGKGHYYQRVNGKTIKLNPQTGEPMQ